MVFRRLFLMLIAMTGFYAFACSGTGASSGDPADNEIVRFVIQNPAASGVEANISIPPLQSKISSSVGFSECTLTASGPTSASTTISTSTDTAEIEASFELPVGTGYTVCAECLDGDKTSNGVAAGILGCTSDLSVPAADTVAIDSLFLNQAFRPSGDARYCRIRQDSSTELKLLCGFDGVLTSAQKLTAQCNLEIDTTLEGTSPATVDASESNGFVSGTKGRPYFIMGPGTIGLILPACFEYDTSGTKLMRGTGAWGTDDDGNTTVECTVGVRQMESIAAGRNARFAVACTKDGSSWAAIPATGMAEFNTSAGGDEDVAELSASSGTCASSRGCASGYCATNGVCLAVSGIGKIVYNSLKALDGSNSANLNSSNDNIWVMNTDGSSDTALTRVTANNAWSPSPRWSPDGSKIVSYSKRALDGSDAANTNTVSNIWVINADGSGAAPLTSLTAINSHSYSPNWSPDGTKIAYSSKRALDGSDARGVNSAKNIWLMNADGSGNMALTSLTFSNSDYPDPQWSPDGGMIAYYAGRALDGSDAANTNGTINVWVMNADGSGDRVLTRLTADNADCYEVIWSPDGSKIAYSSQRALDGSDAANTNNNWNIWVMNADGSGAAPLTSLTAANAISYLPRWSPDGSKIAYSSQRALDGSDAANTNAVYNIWVMNSDGSGSAALTNITAANAHSYVSQWSADGGRIVYASQRALDGGDTANSNTTSNIWVINADGSDDNRLTNITAASASSFDPHWSP